MAYKPISDYGVIGDMRTLALVGRDGAIDWLCWPHFDSPSLFAAILDENKGGYFKVSPAGTVLKSEQHYLPDTNVLQTTFLCQGGALELLDFMAVGSAGASHLIRLARVTRGQVSLKMVCAPASNYAREPAQVEVSEKGATFRSGGYSLRLASTHPLTRAGRSIAAVGLKLVPCETAAFSLRALDAESETLAVEALEQLLENTLAFWRDWVAKCTYHGEWQEAVRRSALTLKLLTFEATGAVLAAPTTSLPETIGGQRNWDYRYTWIRDASFTFSSLMRIGFFDEVTAFLDWLEMRFLEKRAGPPLQIMYGIRGEATLPESELLHLEGYRRSQPVRIGNAAHDQLQLDIYGELLDMVWSYVKAGHQISTALREHLKHAVDWVCDNWQRKDEGIWEVRGGKQHFVYSKLQCWVALDRALLLAEKYPDGMNRHRWQACRDEIRADILRRGWHEANGFFVQHYGTQILDASNLVMSLVGFLPGQDARIVKTITATQKPLGEDGLTHGGLVYRYNTSFTADGLGSEEGTFNICTFWLIEALTLCGRTNEAQLLLEKMLGHTNHLCLLAEETGADGQAMGNFPQAFSHLALINANVTLSEHLHSKQPAP